MQIGESPITNHENRSSISSASKKRTAEPLSEKYFSRKSSHTETSEKVHAECFQPAAFLLCRTTSPVLTYVQRLKNVTIIARFRAFVKQKRSVPKGKTSNAKRKAPNAKHQKQATSKRKNIKIEDVKSGLLPKGTARQVLRIIFQPTSYDFNMRCFAHYECSFIVCPISQSG